MSGTVPVPPGMRFTTSKRVTPQDVDRAEEMVGRVLADLPERALSVHVTLNRLADPAAPSPALVWVQVELAGRCANAHAAAPAMERAIALAGERLRDRLEPVRRGRECRGHRVSS
ncbi:hypothetical protein [Thermomonospora cellulosilytica]|uniref:Uncharacterized protein n=1 Tax=Thermomonospora cellulosilytica TaxID=1411118 RepID=A0A7W3N014_9ACTN|nr:hypothetical protein [Thermomonospora cellulosilytica]MBA9004972.1 hypothetical protein [Thermomonospora cellulosilytica]